MSQLVAGDFSLLQGAIDFGNPAVRCRPAHQLDPGALPAELRPVHDPLLLGRWLSRALALMAEPAVEECCGERRRVHVLGTAVFEFDRRGCVTPWLWGLDEQGQPVLERMAGHDVVAEDVPYGDIWLRRLGLGVQRRLEQRHPELAGLCAAYVDWAAAWIVRLCWSRPQQAATRRRIEQVLRLDRRAIEQARHGMPPYVGRLLRLSQYNRALLLCERIAQLEREAPQLRWLYWMLGDRVAVDGEPVQCLKACLLEAGIRPAFWRLLVRDGVDWMSQLLDFYAFDRGRDAANVLDLLRIAQAFGARAAVDPLLVRALMVIGGHPGRRRQRYAPALEPLFGLCARLGHLAALATPQEQARIAAEADEIFNWAWERLDTVRLRTLRLATLDWLVEQARRWREEETVKARSGPCWPLPFEIESPDPRWSLQPLLSAHALWVEARRMRHCVDQYVERCARGRLLIVSVQDAGTGRATATIGYEIGERTIALHQVVGFANGRPAAEIVVLADAVLERLQRQRWPALGSTGQPGDQRRCE